MTLGQKFLCDNINIFDIFRGDDIAHELQVCDETNGAWDITGWEFILKIAPSANSTDSEAIILKTFKPSEGLNAEAGLLYLTLGRGETALLIKNNYYLTLKQVVHGYHSTVLAGKIKIRGKVQWGEI